jgi:Lrp/AsnC family leucine-responsive transcriptional regulator
MIDDIDRQILNILQQNARTSNAEIARQVGMAPSAILERIRRMEIKGVIQGYEARINPEALGLNLLAFVSVSSTDHGGDMRAAQALSEMPEVQEVHHIAGEDCYLVKVRVPDAKTLGRLLRKWVASIGSIKSTRTTVVLESVHETARLPLGALGAPAAEELEEVFHV